MIRADYIIKGESVCVCERERERDRDRDREKEYEREREKEQNMKEVEQFIYIAKEEQNGLIYLREIEKSMIILKKNHFWLSMIRFW